MKIAVTASGASLDAQVDPRFGRCPYFLVIDTDNLDFEAVENANVALGGGAGIQSAQLMAEKDVQFILTGNCGPNAYQKLSAAGIQTVVGCSGLIRDAVERFKSGGLNAAGQPNVASHFGMGMGRGGGGGMGRGRGGGRGMGMGRGMGQGGAYQASPAPGPLQPATRNPELAALRQQAEAMQQGLAELEERIRQLSGGEGEDPA